MAVDPARALPIRVLKSPTELNFLLPDGRSISLIYIVSTANSSSTLSGR